jgi:peptidoglycan hydrolase CwlO-like protein
MDIFLDTNMDTVPASKKDVEAAIDNAVEKLAAMIGEGFSNNDKRFGIIEKRLEGIDSQLDHLDARVGRIEADIHELRGEIVYRHEFEDALGRIKYLEKKLGIESGI